MDQDGNLGKDYHYCTEKHPMKNPNISIQAKTNLDDLFSYYLYATLLRLGQHSNLAGVTTSSLSLSVNGDPLTARMLI